MLLLLIMCWLILFNHFKITFLGPDIVVTPGIHQNQESCVVMCLHFFLKCDYTWPRVCVFIISFLYNIMLNVYLDILTYFKSWWYIILYLVKLSTYHKLSVNPRDIDTVMWYPKNSPKMDINCILHSKIINLW